MDIEFSQDDVLLPHNKVALCLAMIYILINLYYGIHFLRKPNIKTSIFFAISTALSIDIRIMGIIIFPIIIFFVILRGLRDKKYNLFFPLLLYIITFPLLTILFWPYLWENPLLNFVNVFQTLGSFGWEGYNFYLGSYHKASNLPWHYSIVWIFLTIPTLYVFLFFCGLLTYLSRFLKRILKIEENNLNDFWKSQIELEDLIYHLLFFYHLVLAYS